jgi:polysaccharide pyruvyl transferase CsaB
MNKKFNIGISGSYGGMNLGDEAILQSIVTQLRDSLPQVNITVFTRHPEDTLKRHKVDHAIEVRHLTVNEAKPEIKKLDLLILGGGGILYDTHAKDYLREVIIAKENGVPVMVYAISAGPLENTSSQELVRETLNNVDVITVRERGAQRLLESIGVKKEISVTADPALLITPEPLPDDSLIREQLDTKQKLVGMSVREPGVAAPDIDEKNYHSLLANAADFIVDRLDAAVIFIPMEHNKMDLQHSHAVMAQMLKPQRAWVLKGDYSPGQMLTLMSHLDFAVGMRLHFLIFAALQKIPFVALPYSSKVSGFLDDMDIKMPPIQLVNAGRLIAYIDYFWDAKQELKSQINKKLPKIQEKAKETNAILLEFIKKIDK